MKRKKNILIFLEDNHCMINSLMSQEEWKIFGGDVVSLIKKDIEKQVKAEGGEE